LIWEYLALLVRQNGQIDLKTDVSSLLLGETQNWSMETQNSNRQHTTSNGSSQAPTPSYDHINDNDRSNTPNSEINAITDSMASMNVINHGHNNNRRLSDEDILIKLRQLLASGQRLDAIEWAIKNNLWSHAFFIAVTQQPQIDVKLIEKLKLKFINSFVMQDPLRTCYQLYVGRSPTITTIPNLCEWNDWRRHLAMIVSNQDLYNKELVLRSIKTMGDCLATNNRVAASHFCYLLANVQFGDFKKKASKIVLIGSSHKYVYFVYCCLFVM
jgi:hypothetical protein